MAVDLEGFENIPKEDREVLSEEQFNKYVNSVKMPFNIAIVYYMMSEIIKRGHANLNVLYQGYGVSTREEIAAMFEDEIGINILNDDPKELIKDIPQEIIGQLKDLDEMIDSVHEWNDFGKIVEEQFNLSEFVEQYNKTLIETATEVSKHDLSQIPPESYAGAQFLRYINFQNTGARLDFNYIKENRIDIEYIYISTANLVGTELISFDASLYEKEEEGRTSSITLELENFDLSQFQTVIDGFIGREIIPTEIAKFLVNQEIQDNSKWLIDYAFEDLNKTINLATKLWTQFTPETQINYREYLKKIFDYCLENKGTVNKSLLENTIPEIIDEYGNDLKNIYTDEEGSIDDAFFKNIFHLFTDEYKEHFLEENSHNSSIPNRALALSQTRPQYINENFIKLFDELIAENNSRPYYTAFFSMDEVMQHFNSYEFDELNMEKIIDAVKKSTVENKLYFEGAINDVFAYLSPKNQIDYYKEFMQIGIDNNIDEQTISSIFEKIDATLKEENFYDILATSQTVSPKIAHYIRGTGYINMIQSMPPEKKEDFIAKYSSEILLSLRTKFEKEDNIYEDPLSPEERDEFDSNYSKYFLSVLLKMDQKNDLNSDNINVIIDNLPKLGKDIINRLYNSNSEMIRANATPLIMAVATLEREQAIALIEDTERVFSKDTIPDFVKLYKFFENVVEVNQGVLKTAINNGHNYPPELQQAGSEKAGKRIIFSDLLNISLKSNNKSLKKFINLLESGNETYIKYLNGGKDLDSLTPEEKDTLRKYADTLYTIYDESALSKNDQKRTGKKIESSKDYTKTLENLTRRYIGNAFPKDLSNEVLRTVIGRYDELLAGKRTLEDFRAYMEEVNKKSNERHAELEQTKLVLEPGDLIKGIKNATSFLQSLFSNGIRAGEFLGTDNHTDLTPLDSDHSLILPTTVTESLKETIQNTTSKDYGSFYLVIKKNPQKLKFTRDDPEYTFKSEKSPEYQSKLGKNADREAIKARMSNRMYGTFEEPKLEVFSSKGEHGDHYGVRTGMAITDVDYIVVSNYDKRIGYELAMNGTFIPVVDMTTNEVIFGIDDYNKIREQMQGMPYFDTKKFEVEKSAYIPKVEEKVAQLFPDGNARESISERDARTKRDAIERKVRASILEKLGLEFESRITGDVTPGFIEFIDTGSTGRGTNLPGDGDFDFSLKVDKAIMDDPKKLDKFKEALRDVLKIPSDHEGCKLDEFDGNFRYKKVQVDGVETPLDIDITFMQKSEEVTYSTDMAVKDRLQEIKENDSEGYKRVIANIVIAKEMLKKEGIYKKEKSDGGTREGGFGGVGVENWILQNGGSFIKAMETFLEASEKAENFNEFMEIYPIFDFGQNHMAKGYQHDSFIRGISESGYIKMQEKFKEFIKELQPEQTQEVTMADLVKNAVKQGIRTEEFQEASKSMAQEELQLDEDKNLRGED